MADKTIKLEVVTPERIVFSDEAESIVVPGSEGYLGIMASHAPIITSLKIGVVQIIKDNKETRMALSGGFLEVNNNKATILADTAERDEEIDVQRAKDAKERAEKRIEEKQADTDIRRAEVALHRAIARLKATGHE